MTNPVLETRALDIATPGRKRLCSALALSVHAGESIAILGRNGVGKSTLLTVLAGLQHARYLQRGEILLGGKTYPQLTARAAAQQRGWLPQHAPHTGANRVFDLALSGRYPYLKRWQPESADDHTRAHQALQAVGLSDLAQQEASTLSGGERQRLAIATLLTQSPRLYLLDEPVAHLDLKHQMRIMETLRQRVDQQGAAVIMALHDPNLAARYCNRVLLLYGNEQGDYRLGNRTETLTPKQLSQLYDHHLHEISHHGQRCFLPA